MIKDNNNNNDDRNKHNIHELNQAQGSLRARLRIFRPTLRSRESEVAYQISNNDIHEQ